MLEVFANNKYRFTPKADADTSRSYPALVAVTSKVLAIDGTDSRSTRLSTVSCYSIAENTWKQDYPKLNIARFLASACVLRGMVYVFCGDNYSRSFSSIEVISANYLFPVIFC